MSDVMIAKEVLSCLGGKENILENSLCMTRLRITVANPTLIDRESLMRVSGVLGIASRGPNGIEVVFGPMAVRGVYSEFKKLTGIDSALDSLSSADSVSPIIKVQIATGSTDSSMKKMEERKQAGDLDDYESLLDLHFGGDAESEAESDFDLLDGYDLDAFDEAEDEAIDLLGDDDPSSKRLLVLNGPNINMLGIREPKFYGTKDYAELLELCKSTALEAGFVDCYCYQSNHEGDLVDKIQDAWQVFDAIVFNPGAYTHTSIALLDALNAVGIPTVEVHISNPDEREDFRKISYIRAACIATVAGMGIEGYAKAIKIAAEYLAKQDEEN